jgi:hypothetical protein
MYSGHVIVLQMLHEEHEDAMQGEYLDIFGAFEEC